MPDCALYKHTSHEAMGAVKLRTERADAWPALRRTLEGHTASVYSVAFSPDGTRIASGSRDVTVRVWDTITVAKT